MLIKIKVNDKPWSETENSWCILTFQNESTNGWNTAFWYSKKHCTYKNGIIEMPQWLFDKMFFLLEVKPEIIL